VIDENETNKRSSRHIHAHRNVNCVTDESMDRRSMRCTVEEYLYKIDAGIESVKRTLVGVMMS